MTLISPPHAPHFGSPENIRFDLGCISRRSNGLKSVVDGADATIIPDTGSLTPVPSISDLSRTFFQAYNSQQDSYSKISAQDLLSNIQSVIIGDNLAGIDAVSSGANQVPYFTDGHGTAATYTVSNYMRSISNAVDQDALLDAIGISASLVGTLFASWASSLPTSMPSTIGAWWNNGGTPSQVQP